MYTVAETDSFKIEIASLLDLDERLASLLIFLKIR